MKNKIAIIFGSTGQDGTLMTSLLLKKNYKVFALSQKNNFTSLKREKLNYIHKK